jgi:hypothetical protein
MPVSRTCKSLIRPQCLLAAVVAAVALLAAPAGAATSHLITGSSLAGARLGLKQRDYTRVLGRLHFRTKFAGGLTRLEYAKGDVHVFVSRATGRGVGFFTAAEEYRTSAGIGPCSPVTKLQAAYGSRLRPVRNATSHQIVAYRLGAITFVATGPEVRSVLVSTARVTLQTALNGAACGSGEED